MDPYLEAHWRDVHTRLIARISDALNRVLPSDLVARTEERLSVEVEDPEILRHIQADAVAYGPGHVEASDGGIAVEAPYKLVVDLEPITERFIQIIGIKNNRLVTVIELLSPTNKIGNGLEKYLSKRDDLLRAGVHVVEIDLVRRGDWLELLRPHVCPPEALTPYRATVRIGGRSGVAYLFPMKLREPLCPIGIPLRPDDPRLKLELQPLLREVYETGRYGQTLDYNEPLYPPLEREDARWLDEVLRIIRKPTSH
jgi:hypothetical protein